MEEDVYGGIEVSKTELVVAVRPSGESSTLAYDRAGAQAVGGLAGQNCCAYSKLESDVLMMQPAENWYRCDAPDLLRPAKI